MNDRSQASGEAEASASPRKRPLLTKPRLIAAATALAGMMVGSVVGMGVQMGVESTGLLGPSIDTLIEEQQANFDEVTAELEALKGLSSVPDMKRRIDELSSLLGRQNELSQQANAEIRYLGGQVEDLKQQQLAEGGYAGGADFWLKAGESVNVGSDDQVFALIGARGTIADINFSGQRSRVSVGDAIRIENAACTVFFKQATARADGRVGFDLSCS